MQTARATTASPSSVRARRSPRWIAVGVLAMAVGGIGGAAVWSQSTGAVPVVKVAREVPRGEVVEATDLAVVSMAGNPEVRSVPAGQLDSLIGKVATTDLPEGSLLAPGAIGDVDVQRGTVHVGLALAPGRLPAGGVPAGAKVRLIAVTGGQGGAVESFVAEGIVVRAPEEAADGQWIVDVAVAESQSETVAERAAGNQLVLAREADR